MAEISFWEILKGQGLYWGVKRGWIEEFMVKKASGAIGETINYRASGRMIKHKECEENFEGQETKTGDSYKLTGKWGG